MWSPVSSSFQGRTFGGFAILRDAEIELEVASGIHSNV